MYDIDVRAADEYTLIFTVTVREREPWGRDTATLLVTPEQLDPLFAQRKPAATNSGSVRRRDPHWRQALQSGLRAAFGPGNMGALSRCSRKRSGCGCARGAPGR